jgi:hypothetical protein
MNIERERFFAALLATALAGTALGCDDESPAPATQPEPSASPAQPAPAPAQPPPLEQEPTAEAQAVPAVEQVGPTLE